MSFKWLNRDSERFLEGGYLLPGVTSQARVRQIAEHAEKLLGLPGYADKFYDYMGRGWFSLASPIWSNFGLDRGLPISCFGSYIPDTMNGILETAAEVGMMSKYGGGTSAYFGSIRPRGAPITNNGESEGAVNFMKLFDTIINVSKQGSTRRGAFAAYLDLGHPDILEFLDIKSDGNPIQDIFFGVTVTDEWLQQMIDGDDEKRGIWARVLQTRSEIGLPYILFEDNANNARPQVYKDKEMYILNSNLCSEIMLPNSEDESFVCCLSSMNLLHYEDWKDTDAVEVLTYFLDAVMSEFIEKSRYIPHLGKAHLFAHRHRAIGIGVLGWHSFLQSKMIPIESIEAAAYNTSIFRNIRWSAEAASRKLAEQYGEPPVLKGYGLRNTTLMAVAPTTSSSFILGQVSQSIEPLRSNYYVKDLAKLRVTHRNPYLKELLASKGLDTQDIWDSILAYDGSVQHLDELTEHEKMVFKTFGEISQLELVRQAASRQKYIDQGQSLNLMIHPDTPTRDINSLYLEAWRTGIKSLYYQHSVNAAQEFNRDLLTNCVSCEA